MGVAASALDARANGSQPGKRKAALMPIVPLNQQFTAATVGSNGRWAQFSRLLLPGFYLAWYLLFHQAIISRCLCLDEDEPPARKLEAKVQRKMFYLGGFVFWRDLFDRWPGNLFVQVRDVPG